MSSIIRDGDTYHGISVFGRGVFTNDEYGVTYAGQCKDGYACGLGLATWSDGYKVYAEYGPDGKYDGRNVERWAHGDTVYYLMESGKSKESERRQPKESASVSADGTCGYNHLACNHVACAPDDPRLLVLIAQVAPVEVRPAARAPRPPLASHSPPSHRPMDRPARFAAAGARRRRGRRGAPQRRTPSPVSVRHSPTAAKHDHAVARVRAGLT